MAKIDIGKIVVAAVAAGATKAAAAATTDMTHKDVPAVVEIAKEAAKPIVREAQAQVDFATNQEPFYLSRQWWMTMLGLLSSVLGMSGIAFPAEMQQQVLAAIMAVIGAVTAVTLIYNRYFARKPIGS